MQAVPAAVHPRWRGEHGSRERLTWRAGGSSPLARGTLNCSGDSSAIRRFIPAGAGNTPARASTSSPPPVHPRWRGEHSNPLLQEHAKDGSSPLARGTQLNSVGRYSIQRFIPAGAGNTIHSRPLT